MPIHTPTRLVVQIADHGASNQQGLHPGIGLRIISFLASAHQTGSPGHRRHHELPLSPTRRGRRLVVGRDERPAVFARDPVCSACGEWPRTIADHSPIPLTTLVDHGVEPLDPDTCRGVCHTWSGRHDGGVGRSRRGSASHGADPRISSARLYSECCRCSFNSSSAC
jgi:hypothetical protein